MNTVDLKLKCPSETGTGTADYKLGNDYMTGSPIRQDYLETAISWLSNENIEQYMAQNQHKPNASELWCKQKLQMHRKW